MAKITNVVAMDIGFRAAFGMGCMSLVLGLMLCLDTKVHAQDFGVEQDPQQEVGKMPQAPYKMAVKLRPLSYLLYPLTGGVMGSFNAEVEAPLDRVFSVAVGINYFYADFSRAPGSDSLGDITQLSIRIDPKVFLSAFSNSDRYASGFFIGPYYKYRYSTERSSASSALSITNVQSHLIGMLTGYQYRKNRFLFCPAFGLGGGIAKSPFQTQIALDFRLGLSVGYVLF